MNNDFILGEEQQQAIDSIINFIKTSKELAYSLIGYAGTGKSTIIKWMIDYMESEGIPYTLAAPTHKAKSVIKYVTGRDAMTIHQVLKLTPNIEILDLDLRDLKFMIHQFKVSEIPYNGILICDESSMINDALYELLLKKTEEASAKIIFVGDIAQLKPVKSVYNSLVFNVENRSELTKIYRQSNESGLSTVLPTLREQSIPRFQTAYGTEGSLICVHNAKDLFINALPSFQKAIETQDIFEAKLYAYTNARTAALNQKMRSLLFRGEAPYYKNEILTSYENFSHGYLDYWNSMDYIIDDEPIAMEKTIPHVGTFQGYRLSLYDTAEKMSGNVFIIDSNTPPSRIMTLSTIIESTRIAAIELKKQKSRASSEMWQRYYQIMESFTTPFDLYYDDRVVKKKTFDYGYASTVHKSQGSSINNVFVDMKNINVCKDPMELRQLQYVSLSRARTNAYLFQ